MLNLEDNNTLLIKAAKRGDVAEVQRLIPISDPKAMGVKPMVWLALEEAARNGHTQCVQLLTPVSDPKAHNSAALRLAARNGHTQCVALLIPVSDPKELNSYALRLATMHGPTECVKLLISVSDPVVALQRLQKDFPDDYNKWGQLYEMIEADRLNTMLHKEIENTNNVNIQRKQKI